MRQRLKLDIKENVFAAVPSAAMNGEAVLFQPIGAAWRFEQRAGGGPDAFWRRGGVASIMLGGSSVGYWKEIFSSSR